MRYSPPQFRNIRLREKAWGSNHPPNSERSNASIDIHNHSFAKQKRLASKQSTPSA